MTTKEKNLLFIQAVCANLSIATKDVEYIPNFETDELDTISIANNYYFYPCKSSGSNSNEWFVDATIFYPGDRETPPDIDQVNIGKFKTFRQAVDMFVKHYMEEIINNCADNAYFADEMIEEELINKTLME